MEQRTTATYYTPYKFSAKEKDTETGYSYFGARYYDSDLSVWLSDQRSWICPYNYCQWNPVMRTDPTGALDVRDNYTYDEITGTVTCEITEDKTDNFYYQKSDGTVENIGSFEKQTTTTNETGSNVGIVQLPNSGKGFQVLTKNNYIRSDIAAILLGVAYKNKENTGLDLQVTQLNSKEGSHSGTSYNWSGIDIRYVNNKGNVIEPVSTAGNNVDFAKSQAVIDLFNDAGINYIGTENAAGNAAQFSGTRFPGKGPNGTWEHKSHMHLGRLNPNTIFYIVKNNTSTPPSNPNTTSFSQP